MRPGTSSLWQTSKDSGETRMHRVIYRSTALIGEYTPAALDILATSERRNREDGITGFLHREADNFVQVIEGSGSAVADLVVRLRRDSRHAGMTILSEHTITKCAFEGWDMAYASNHRLSLRQQVPEIWSGGSLSHSATDRLIAFLRELAARKSSAA